MDDERLTLLADRLEIRELLDRYSHAIDFMDWDLLETVWEAAPDIQTRTVDMHVQRLRAKLGAAGELIETVRGFGYRLRAGHSRSA